MRTILFIFLLLFPQTADANDNFFIKPKFEKTGDRNLDIKNFVEYHTSLAIIDLYSKYSTNWRQKALTKACNLPMPDTKESHERFESEAYFHKYILPEAPKYFKEDEIMLPYLSRIESWKDGYISGYLEGIGFFTEGWPEHKDELCKAVNTAVSSEKN